MRVRISTPESILADAKAFQPESLDKQKKNAALFRDCSTSILMPTRGMIHVKVMRAQLQALQAWPMNQKKVNFDVAGLEVGAAYQYLTETALEHDFTKNWPFIATWEDDNIPPANGMERLFDAIHACIDCGDAIEPATWLCPAGHRGIDGISGIYYSKTIPPIAMAFGDPQSEELEFRPRNVAEAVEAGAVIEVNGIANGFSLYRAELFRKMEKPWWETRSGTHEEGAATQDLLFCRRAKEELGARFAVHCGVRVGHMDVTTGQVY